MSLSKKRHIDHFIVKDKGPLARLLMSFEGCDEFFRPFPLFLARRERFLHNSHLKSRVYFIPGLGTNGIETKSKGRPTSPPPRPLPGDQPELSKCMMPLLLNYKSKIVGDGLELKRIAKLKIAYLKRNGPILSRKQPFKPYFKSSQF